MLDMCNKNRNEQNPLDFCKHNGNYIYLNMFLPFAFFGPDTLSFGHCPNFWGTPILKLILYCPNSDSRGQAGGRVVLKPYCIHLGKVWNCLVGWMVGCCYNWPTCSDTVSHPNISETVLGNEQDCVSWFNFFWISGRVLQGGEGGLYIYIYIIASL